MKIGILAVQGDFLEHEQMLDRLGVNYVELRKREDLEQPFDGLILPGGESTVQGKLLKEQGMFEPLRAMLNGGLPVFATCAGLILLADRITNDDKRYFRTMPITVKRNAYGRQLGSFHTTETYGSGCEIPMTFIRAPYVEAYDPEVEPLAVVEGKTVAVKYRKQIAIAFHPELDEDLTVYEQFLGMVS